jgi:hypothetical protein
LLTPISGFAAGLLLAATTVAGCGSSHNSTFGSQQLIIEPPKTDGGTIGTIGTATLPDGAVVLGGGGIPIQCDAGSGKQCEVQDCPGGGTTKITGRVLDPAGKNPLWNVTVFVKDPALPLPDLASSGLACGCGALYPADVLGYGMTDATGHFEIDAAPYGANISLVVQIGKWRKEIDGYTVAHCGTTVVPDLTLPASTAEGNLPDIAISTGQSDSLECLPLRIGVAATEYVAGAGGAGHIHIFHGYAGANTAMPAADSVDALWDSTADLEKHDVVLLSCEGQETTGGGGRGAAAGGMGGGAPMTNAFQQSLLDYASAGGRVFASHYHYAWFRQPAGAANAVAFAAANVATWQGMNGANEAIDDTMSFAEDVDTTLAGGGAFPEGTVLSAWLGNVGALTNGTLPVQYARINVVTLNNAVEWIHLDPSVTAASVAANSGTNFVANAAQYFSVDTPIGGKTTCGRVVYSDLHVSGGAGKAVGAYAADYAGGVGMRGGGGGMVVPGGCAMHDLSPQEKALEFMLFDLSSCLVTIGNSTPAQPPVVSPIPK